MTHRVLSRSVFGLVVACIAAVASAQTTQFDLSAGYQWVDITGNKDMYRSQVNQDDGFTLGSFSLLVVDQKTAGRWFDRLRIDAADIGAYPQSRFTVHASKANAYDLRINYFRSKYFTALPEFANPFAAQGVVPGEHTADRLMESVDVDLSILPQGTITPLVGYSGHRFDGPGRTTYHVGQDEFRMTSDTTETVEEARVGVALHWAAFEGSVVQGWRSFDSTDSVALAPGAGDGNSAVPILGEDQTLSDYARRTHSKGNTPVTTAFFRGLLGDRVRVVGSYVNGEYDSDTSERESLSGNLVSFQIQRFFTGLTGTVRSRAENPYWRGGLRVEADLLDNVDLVVGYTKRHREVDGWSMIYDLYTGAINFSGANPGDVARTLDTRNAMERDENVVEARVAARDLGPFRLWAAYSRSKEDLTVTPDAAEIVIAGGQGGSYAREDKRSSAGVGFAMAGFDASVEYLKDDADNAVVRTDFLDRDRWRARLGWSDGHLVRITGTYDHTNADNTTPGIGYDLEGRSYGADLEITPVGKLVLRGSWAKTKTDTAILVRQPETFTTSDSLYLEDGELVEGAVLWNGDHFGVDVGYSRFDNTGSLPLTLDRAWASIRFDITKTVGASLQVDSHDYEESRYHLADFKAKRYGVFIRVHN